MVVLEGKSPTQFYPGAVRPVVWLLAVIYCVGLAGTASAQMTYGALTSPNASAGSANVSKAPISLLLPPNTQAKVFAHMMSWFGSATHKDVGYSSADPIQVEKQVADMVSRGIAGVIVNWQGSSDSTNQGALAIMAEAEKNSGKFQFAIEEDAATLTPCAKTVGCDLQAKLIDDLKFVLSTYAKSTTYMTVGGRAVIFLYGMEAYTTVNWTAVENALPGRPILMLRSATSSMSSIAAVIRGDSVHTPMTTVAKATVQQGCAKEEDHA